MKEKIRLAIIAGAHGLRGQVKLRTLTENPKDVAIYGPLSDTKGTRQWAVTIVGKWKEGVIAALSGVETREQAEGLKNTALFATAALPEPRKGELYLTQLEGLRVRDGSDAEIGTVEAVYNFGAGDIIEIAFADGKTAMYPFHIAVFPEIRLEDGWIRFERPGEI